MSDREYRMAVSQLFRNAGRSALPEKELVLDASHGLRWFKPKDAERFLQKALEFGLLERNADGDIVPTFDIRSVEPPIDFKPDIKILDTDIGPSLFERIIATITVVSGLERNTVVSKINARKEMLDIDIRAAALLVAGEYGVNMDRFLDDVEGKILEDIGRSKKE